MSTTLPDSYYARTVSKRQAAPVLTGVEETDVCIVGGGIAGITAGLELAEAGISSIVVESHVPGWGASGRNGGFVSPGYSTALKNIVQMAGQQTAKELFDLSLEGVQMVRGRVVRAPDSPQFIENGYLKVVRWDNSVALEQHIRMMGDVYGYPLELQSISSIRDRLLTKAYHCGYIDPQAFHFHPLQYVTDLEASYRAKGGRVFERSLVTDVSISGPVKEVRTKQGAVRCKTLVFAGGGYTEGLLPRLSRSYIPISTYMLASRPAKSLLSNAIRTRTAVGDDRRASDYYRLVEDGSRLLWGGMITTKLAEPSALAKHLHRKVTETYPQLRDLEIDTAWSGRMSYAKHLMPLIGKVQEDVWYCYGFGGHGVNTTSIGGRVVAEGISGQSRRYQAFSPFKLKWTGGPVGRLAVQLTYWKYQMQDYLAERNASTN